ncbi:threonine--tRNA ligase [bacterium]|nr:threonine--tRNA ligase [bacterium]
MKKTNIDAVRHSLSHIMAMAVLKKIPDAKLGIGPTIENGFYYDFLLPDKLSDADLPKLEKQMKKIISQKIKFSKTILAKKEALAKVKNNKFKTELINDLPKGEEISFYDSGDFSDLCAGPHVEYSTDINVKAFKLMNVAGAYWRGDEKNQMLTRIYGVAFDTKEALDKYLEMLEEAKKRDHRKLGKELDLFVFSETVGAGLPLWTPKGTIIKEELQKYIEEICYKYGFQKVMTPHLAKIELFEISGHAKKFADELLHVTSGRGHEFVMKPVQCPHQTQIYASRSRSYRDLPIRYMESEKQYRAEKSGEIGGLNRVYAITIEDGHSFCTVNQVKNEIKSMVKIIEQFYSTLGLWKNHWVSLSLRDYDHPKKYIGDTKDWDKCEQILEDISKEMNLDAQKHEGEAALYGPKLDFMFKDILGNDIQIPTVQIDFATPKRFELYYVNEKGDKISPVMVHRAVLGSYERIIALLIEHFAGAFPLWLSPAQIKLITVGENHIDFTKKLAEEFKKENIRIEIDDSSETVGNKIRKSSQEKIPYTLVIGDKEMKSKDLAVRVRGQKDLLNISKQKFISKIKTNIKNRQLELS